MSERRYIQVILPLRLEWEPCYIIGNEAWELPVGARVRVPFAGRSYVGVVSATDVEPGLDPARIKTVTAPEPGLERISEREIALWRFIADYYLCSVGEVYKAAYPASKVASEQVRARLLAREERLRTQEAARYGRRLARLQERLEAKDKALAGRHSEAVRARLLEERSALARERAALEATMARLSETALFSAERTDATLDEGCRIRLEALADRFKAFFSGLQPNGPASKPLLYCAPERTGAYLAAIARTLLLGRNALLLVPDIVRAGSLQEALSELLGPHLLVHHSALTPAERRRAAERIRSGKPYVVLGTRSALFLPHEDLGLVIVEDEGNPLYKQEEPAPRYNGRDSAVYLAGLHGAGVLLGAAAPSLESVYNCRIGRYRRMSSATGISSASGANAQTADLPQTPAPGPLAPEIIDIRAEARKNGMTGPVSRKLADAIRECLSSDDRPVALIRGYDKPGELDALLPTLFPAAEERICVLTQQEAGRRELGGFALVAALQADAFFPADDFRADERAYRFLALLRGSARRLILQTARADHPVFQMTDPESLLGERRSFNLPPCTRIADVVLSDSNGARLTLMARRLQDQSHLTPLPGNSPDRIVLRVILPRDKSLWQKKRALAETITRFETDYHYAGHIYIDVDPA
ncbi:MAG: hypothetical protein IJV01_01510 [Bacteroidales bacterium]|nr:hypothetical protein [Bacteroidales bacterium]